MSWLRVPPGLADQPGGRDLDFVEAFQRRVIQPFARQFDAEVRGLEHYLEGPALIVGNHSGGTLSPDSFLFGDAVAERYGYDALPYALGHSTVFAIPGVGEFLRRLGAVRARHQNAERLFDAGYKVMVYPGGDVDSLRPYRDRNRIVFDGRRGYLQLAIRAGVPIVPVVAAGAHDGFIVLSDGRKMAKRLRLDRLLRLKVLPLSLSVPWGLTVGPVPPFWPISRCIRIQLLAPIHFDRQGEAAAADDAYVRDWDERIRSRMQRTLSDLAVEVAEVQLAAAGAGSAFGDD